MKDYNLILDCDGVIFDSLGLIDEQVQQIEYKASDKYHDEVITSAKRYHDLLYKLEYERANDYEEEKHIIHRKLADLGEERERCRLLKDIVLEEVYHKYEDRIDYYSIYTLENAYPGVINMINNIYETGVYENIYILSHVNSESEVFAKNLFFSKYLPFVKFIPVKFHEEPFHYNKEDTWRNLKRKRTNKIERFQKITGIESLDKLTFIDDSETIIQEAEQMMVGRTYYKRKDENIVDILRAVLVETMIKQSESNKTHIKRR